MMQECPRCQFIQPKDRFCANCGLDIENYEPTRPPLIARLFRSTPFLIGLAIALIGGLTTTIFIAQKNRIDSEQAQESLVFDDGQDDFYNEEAETAQASATRTRQERPTREVRTESSSIRGAEGASAAGQAAPEPPQELAIQFGEILLADVDKVASRGQSISETATERVFLLDASKVSPQNLGGTFQVQPLGGGRSVRLPIREPINFDFIQIAAAPGAEESENPQLGVAPQDGDEVGLSLQISPTSVSSDSVSIELAGILNLRDTEASLVTIEMNGSYEIPAGQFLMLFGFIPHAPVDETQLSLFSGSPLAILESDDFLSRITEFYIQVTPR